MSKQQKVLVTGGAGFIGSHIASRLCDLGYSVRVLDNLSTGHKHNISHLFTNPNFEFVYGDTSNLETARLACSGVDLICHQAALGSVPRSIDDPLSSHIANVNGFLNILIAAKENGVKRFVYASSSAVYGDSENLPKVEDVVGNPLSPYGVTKCINELYANNFSRVYNMECIGLRYFNVFGPKQDPNSLYSAVIPKFISMVEKGISPTINGDGEHSRDFTYIDNVVHMNILCLTTNNEKCFGNAFNVACENSVTLNVLYNTINVIMGKDVKAIYGPERRGDIKHSFANTSKAKECFGYEPLVTFDEGIKKTVEYFAKPQ